MATYDLTTTTPTSIAVGDILNIPYSGAAINITLPKGTYQLECWGAQGGSGAYYATTSSVTAVGDGGKGGYAIGTIALSDQADFYIYSGGQGTYQTTAATAAAGGYNGGGASGIVNSFKSRSGVGGSGGGGTDIRVNGSTLSDRIIVAGGGGGGSAASASYYGAGGAGGGSTGESGSASTGTSPTGGTQTAGGAGGTVSWGGAGNAGTLGQGGNGNSTSNTSNKAGGGGGGYYGGGGAGYSSGTNTYMSGAGGSGYVDSSLTDASNIAGDQTITEPDGTTATGHSGDGYARITVIALVGLNGFGKVAGSWKSLIKGFCKVAGTWKEIAKAVPIVGRSSTINFVIIRDNIFYPYSTTYSTTWQEWVADQSTYRTYTYNGVNIICRGNQINTVCLSNAPSPVSITDVIIDGHTYYEYDCTNAW